MVRGLTLAGDKEKRLLLHVTDGRWGHHGVTEKVKWSRVILEENLYFGQH